MYIVHCTYSISLTCFNSLFKLESICMKFRSKKENVFMIQLNFLITRIRLKLRYEIAPEIIRNV